MDDDLPDPDADDDATGRLTVEPEQPTANISVDGQLDSIRPAQPEDSAPSMDPFAEYDDDAAVTGRMGGSGELSLGLGLDTTGAEDEAEAVPRDGTVELTGEAMRDLVVDIIEEGATVELASMSRGRDSDNDRTVQEIKRPSPEEIQAAIAASKAEAQDRTIEGSVPLPSPSAFGVRPTGQHAPVPQPGVGPAGQSGNYPPAAQSGNFGHAQNGANFPPAAQSGNFGPAGQSGNFGPAAQSGNFGAAGNYGPAGQSGNYGPPQQQYGGSGQYPSPHAPYGSGLHGSAHGSELNTAPVPQHLRPEQSFGGGMHHPMDSPGFDTTPRDAPGAPQKKRSNAEVVILSAIVVLAIAGLILAAVAVLK